MYRGLRFEREGETGTTPAPLNRRLTVVIEAVVGFGLLWLILPPGVMFVLLVITLAVVVWVASFGLKPAVTTLKRFFERLEQQL